MNSTTDKPWKYKHCAADTQVSDHKGVLHSVTINGPATTAGKITLYDNTAESGTDIIAILSVGLKTESQGITCLIFDCEFSTGLYVGFDGTIVGADITVTYI
jgi:hypothetical protein